MSTLEELTKAADNQIQLIDAQANQALDALAIATAKQIILLEEQGRRIRQTIYDTASATT